MQVNHAQAVQKMNANPHPWCLPFYKSSAESYQQIADDYLHFSRNPSLFHMRRVTALRNAIAAFEVALVYQRLALQAYLMEGADA
ncbi:hypothetical protein [Shewanella fodinae]|jgi:hypothetical protein|uniref:Uncharacterized protein n=1 Tax=Shewanella fodinae TaxID=552357 RepID=A0A4R2F4U4_9GAMM|nr:hypothetical protein [Shewanella fodinae]TCN77702.1 hypothetical protein EDC91_1443 [Shewanella fodinae]